MRKTKKAGSSVRELIGIEGFSKYGLSVDHGELLFFQIAPTNISVLSQTNIEMKIHNFMMILSAVPEIQIFCTDSSECFDDNKHYLQGRLEKEPNGSIAKIITKDIAFLDRIQSEMATARQFVLIYHCRDEKPEQVFDLINTIGRTIRDRGFEAHLMSKSEIKRFLALYFDASLSGEQMPDVDGEQYIMPAYEAEKERMKFAPPQKGQKPENSVPAEVPTEENGNIVSTSPVGGYFGTFGGSNR